MAAPATDARIELVSTVLAAMENGAAAVRTVGLCVVSRNAEPRSVVGVHAAGRRFALDTRDADLVARVLGDDQPFPGAAALAGHLHYRIGEADLLTLRARVQRMQTPMGAG